MALDEARIKPELIAMWLAGGINTLVKVLPAGQAPDGTRPIGYCTSYKFIVGQSPVEIERRVGFREGTRLARGADIYMVQRLPSPHQFEFRGHSNTPEGISTTVKAPHEDFPPGKGVPQWELTGLCQGFLSLLMRVGPSETFRFPVANLPKPDAPLPE